MPERDALSVTEWAAELLDSVRREHGADCPSELLVDALPAAVCEELAWRKRRQEETRDA